MVGPSDRVRSFCLRGATLLAVLTAGLAMAGPSSAARPAGFTIHGRVMSGDAGLAGYSVSLFAAFVDREPRWLPLGSATSDADVMHVLTVATAAGGPPRPSRMGRADRAA